MPKVKAKNAPVFTANTGRMRTPTTFFSVRPRARELRVLLVPDQREVRRR